MNYIRTVKILAIWSLWALCLAALQTSVWPLIFGSVPAPQLWLNLALYLILFRERLRSLFLIYLLGILLSPFTSMSLGYFWASFLFIVPIGAAIKERAFWPGTRYFAMGSLAITLGWQMTSTLLSWFTEANSAGLHVAPRLAELILTPLCSPPLYFVMQQLDRMFQDEVAPHFTEVPNE